MSFMSSIATIVGCWYLPKKQTIWLEIGFVVALGKPLPTDLDVFFFTFFQRVFVDHCRLKKLSVILFSAFFVYFWEKFEEFLGL